MKKKKRKIDDINTPASRHGYKNSKYNKCIGMKVLI